jgi:ABC-2 type transport system ATP-binding protein
MKNPVEMSGRSTDLTQLIALHNVSKQFVTVRAVDDVSFDIPRQRIFALLGPNGAGKTTLLRMLLGLIQPDSGRIEFPGDGARRPDREATGYLPEDRGLYPDVKVLDTLTYFGTLRGMNRGAAHKAAQSWLERMGLADRSREPLKALSKGNQQKIQFISAVLHRPTFAVLDEPFSGLDPLNQDFFLSLIREMRDGGATVVLSAHQMQLVERVADHIIVLNRGRVVLDGSLADIRRRSTVGRRLLVRVGAPPPDDFRIHATGVDVNAVEPDAIELLIPEQLPLGQVLADIGAHLDVRDIESHPITLHDVYVRAIAEHDTAHASAERH